MSDSRAILCMLILMRLKTELSPFDRLRLHKSALMLNIFSKKKCFAIDDPVLAYFDEIDNLSTEIKKLQEQCNADTAKTLEQTLENVDSRIKESYKRSIPYVIQSAGFVNSISDSSELVLISAIIGNIHKNKNSNINDIEAALNNKGFSTEQLNLKNILSSVINLEKSGVLTKADDGYCLSGSLNDVVGYQRLIEFNQILLNCKKFQ